MKQMIPTEDVMKISKPYVSPEGLTYDDPDLYIDFLIPKKEYEAMGNNGLVVFLMNTTCVTIPFYKSNIENNRYRFVCNVVYDELGNSMVARGAMSEPHEDDEFPGHYIFTIYFDKDFAQAVAESEIAPYGLVRFITFN